MLSSLGKTLRVLPCLHLLALRHALGPLGEIGRLFVTLQDAQGLAEALGDQHRLGRVSAYLLAHFVLAGELDRALASGQRTLAIATALGDVGITVTAQYYLGAVYYILGDYHQAVEYFQKNMVCLHSALLSECFGCLGWPPRSPAVSSSSPLPSAAPSPRARHLVQPGRAV